MCGFDTYSVAKDPLPLLIDIIQTHPLASTGDPLIYADSAVQSYHAVKQLSGETTNKYRISLRLYKNFARDCT